MAGGLSQLSTAQPSGDAEADTAEQTALPAKQAVSATQDLAQFQSKLNQQMEKLQSSLDYRKSVPFDPVLMAAASGFLAPTKTGSFGESLGAAGTQALSAAEKEWVRNQEQAKMNMELMKQQLALKQQAAASEQLQGLVGPQTTLMNAAPPAGGMPGARRAVPGTPAAMQTTLLNAAPTVAGPAPVTGAPTAPAEEDFTQTINGAKPVTEAMIAAAANNPPLQSQLAEMQKRQTEYRKAQDEHLKAIQGNFVELDFPDLGKKKVPLEVAAQFPQAAQQLYASGDKQAYYQWLAKNGIISPEYSSEAGQRIIKAPETEEEKQIRVQAGKSRVEQEAQKESKDTASLRAAFQQSNNIDNLAQNQASLATTNPKAFELLQEPTVRDAFYRMVAKGIQTPSGSISLDTRELDAVAKNLTKEDRTALMMYGQNNAMLNLMFAKTFLSGEGSVSDNERALVGQTTSLPTDNALAVRLKSEALQLRAKNDAEVYKGWAKYKRENKGATLDDYYTDESSPYQTIIKDYNNKLNKTREANARLLAESGVPNTAPAKAPAPVAQTNPNVQPATANNAPPMSIVDRFKQQQQLNAQKAQKQGT